MHIERKRGRGEERRQEDRRIVTDRRRVPTITENTSTLCEQTGTSKPLHECSMCERMCKRVKILIDLL